MPVTGGNRFRAQLRRTASPATERLIGAALFEGADVVKAEAQRSITAGSVSGKGHVASRPGEAPNNDTRVLVDSIETAQPKPLTAEVSANAPYARPLEFSTSAMSARPFMRPARDKSLREVRKLMAKALKKVNKNG